MISFVCATGVASDMGYGRCPWQRYLVAVVPLASDVIRDTGAAHSTVTL